MTRFVHGSLPFLIAFVDIRASVYQHSRLLRLTVGTCDAQKRFSVVIVHVVDVHVFVLLCLLLFGADLGGCVGTR